MLTAFIVAVLSITSYSLWLLRDEALTGSFQVSALMARSFENTLTQSLYATSQATANAISDTQGKASLRDVEADFAHTLRGAPYLRSLSLIDSRDRIVASSNPANVGQQVITTGYLPLISGPQTVLRMGPPWLGRDFAAGQTAVGAVAGVDGVSTLIPVTAPVQDDGGALRLLVALNPDYFVNQMSQQLATQVGMAEVLRLDGTRLMTTNPELQVGKTPYGMEQALRFQEHEFGQLEDGAGLGKPSLTAYRVSSQYPFVVVTHLYRDVALERWLTEVKAVLGVLFPVLVVLSFLAVRLHRRQWSLQLQRAESERLQRVNAAFVFTNIREAILITEADGSIIDVNDAFVRITGYSRAEVHGKNPRFLKSGRQDKAFYQAMWSELLAAGYWRGEIWNRRKDGEILAEMLTISAVHDSLGKVQQYVAIFNNITAMKVYQNELERTARYDPLTDLPNRVLLADRMRQAMTQAQRHQQWLGVVFIDLDGFKAINDNWGHEAGDLVLVELAKRMRQVLRESDTLARHGGDEFVALLAELAAPEDAVPTLERLLEAASRPLDWHGKSLQVTASIGVSFFPFSGNRSAEELLNEADMAMYKAKLAGKNQYHLSLTHNSTGQEVPVLES
ncbi:diguanylate cyclase domain-containing protein [Rhodoferax sp.]|uniref:diguanylate cyclase domain-containing protein n=1 Tax=Rhodoferax sp. TaxID=50421 RepID=UPI002850CFE0|nr:diguanylate cyclase [Rhodoferax sp.]MDR3371295.1 diguanylate cyclase [Rhodoferax sp.]